MKVVGVIPARWGSTRFPGKSLVPICGKPMIQWVLERASSANRLDELVVATDDDRILEAVEEMGFCAVMTRNDHPSGTDRVAEAVSGRAADIIINIQGDEPLIDPELIDRLAGVISSETDWDMATAATRITDDDEVENSSVVKVVWDEEGKALYFSRSKIPYVREDSDRSKTMHWRHLGIYAYTKEFLEKLVVTPPTMLELAERLEQLRALYIGARIAVVETSKPGVGVDTPDDVQYVEELINRKHDS